VLPILSGGSGRMTIDLCKALEKEGIEDAVFLSLGAGELAGEAELSGIKLHSYHRGDGTGALRAVLLVPVLLARLLRRARGYDLLIGGGDASDHLPALVAGRLTRRPVAGISQVSQSANLGSHRGFAHLAMWLSTRIALPRLDATISVAEAVREDVIGLGADRERAYLIANGIPVARVLELSQAEEVSFERPTIVTVDRLSPEKDLDDLLRAHALAREEIAHDLLIIGDGVNRPRLE
jgi:glycosyltransferase involved in cell wall biosynthesis